MYETPSLHKFGYSGEQLKLREYQKLKDLIKSQQKLAETTHSKLKEDFEDLSENQEKNNRRKNARREARRREATSNTRPTGSSKCFIKHKVNQ